jgi:hypothetical protein
MMNAYIGNDPANRAMIHDGGIVGQRDASRASCRRRSP